MRGYRVRAGAVRVRRVAPLRAGRVALRLRARLRACGPQRRARLRSVNTHTYGLTKYTNVSLVVFSEPIGRYM